MKMNFMYITNNENVAQIAESAGVNRIWIDLEKLGKEERQKNMNTVKSDHSFEDITHIKKVLNVAKLLVRIDPVNTSTEEDVEQVIERGADIIMLPMFKKPEEVAFFIDRINGRVKNILLLETKEAVNNLDEILKIDGIDEIHVGLNDLHLSYGQNFMFEPLVNGTVEKICHTIKNANKNISYGIGGVARIGEGLLPAERILAEHKRLGSTSVILSRSFCDFKPESDIHIFKQQFESGIQGIEDVTELLDYANNEYFLINQEKMKQIVHKIVRRKKNDSFL